MQTLKLPRLVGTRQVQYLVDSLRAVEGEIIEIDLAQVRVITPRAMEALKDELTRQGAKEIRWINAPD